MRNKYNARKVEYDGYAFDSQAEYRRYCELRILESGGLIAYLDVHPLYKLMAGFTDNEGVKERPVTYTPDFFYHERQPDGGIIMVAEDVKSKATAKKRDYILVRKLFKIKYPDIHFREVIS